MTPKPLSKPSHATSILSSCLVIIACIVLFGAPLAAHPIFDIGIWRWTTTSILAIYIGTLLCCSFLLLQSGGTTARRAQIPGGATAALTLLLASLPGVILSPEPLVSVVGTPQSGHGMLWFAAFAIFCLFFSQIREHADWMSLCVWSLLTGLVLVTLILTYEKMEPGLNLLIPGSDTYAYMGFSGIIASITAWRGMPVWSKLTMTVSAVLLLLSDNLAALVFAIGLSGVFLIGRAFLGALSARVFSRYALSFLLVMALATLPPLLLWNAPEEFLPPSIASRSLILDILAGSVTRSSSPVILFGSGWGHTQSLFYNDLLMSGHPIYDNSWDFVWRDMFHSHNIFIETYLATGLVGLTVYLGIFAYGIQYAAIHRNCLLGYLLLFYMALGTVWYELIFVIPYLAVAIVWCSCPPADKLREPAFVGRFCQMTSSALRAKPALIGVGALFLGVFVVSLSFNLEIRQYKPSYLSRTDMDLPSIAAIPENPWRSDNVEAFALRELWRKRSLIPGNEGPRDSLILGVEIITHVARAIEETNSAALVLVGITLFNELSGQGAAFWQRIGQGDTLWRRLVFRHYELSPCRSDVAVGYFQYLFDTQRYNVLLDATKQRLHQSPYDPVAFYFAALANAGRTPNMPKTRLLKNIDTAIAQGLELVIPVDRVFKAELADKFGPPQPPLYMCE